MNRWLDNRTRRIALPILIVVLAVMMLDYADLTYQEAPSYRRVLEASNGAEGEEIALPFVRVVALRPHGLTISTYGRRVEVYGHLAGAERGDKVSLAAEVLSGGNLRLLHGTVHHHRWLKWQLGALVTLLTGLALFWEWWGRAIWQRRTRTAGA